jgi:hypothetical protein
MNDVNKYFLNLLIFFRQGLYDLIVEFLATRPIFKPPHMDDTNQIYKSCGLTPNEAINIDEDSKSMDEGGLQNWYINTNKAWLCQQSPHIY